MLNFFRRIRRKLLDSGSPRKYFIYAIGEILLVVIGILIALQVNNWNEQRNEQAIAKNYLIALRNELQTNITELERVIIAADSVRVNAIPLFLDPKTMGKPNLTEKEFGIFAFYVAMNVQFEAKMGVINDMVNSGKTSLLKNDTLRNFISSWHGLINQLQKEEEHLEEAQKQVMKYVLELGNTHSVGYYARGEGVPKSKFEKSNLPLLEMVVFEGAVSRVIGNSQDLVRQHYPLFKEKLVKHIGIIDRELK